MPDMDERTLVWRRIEAISAAVRAGDFSRVRMRAGSIRWPPLAINACLFLLQAEALGNQEQPHLALSKARLQLQRSLADRPNSAVHKALLDGRPVAYKRMKIGTSQDLEAFKKEVQIMACASHPNVARLHGARLLPPGM